MKDLALIYSILVVSLSGALKLRFAYEFLGDQVPLYKFIAAALITYAAYAFDRGIENKEDEKRGELFKKVLLYTAIVAMLLTFVLYPNPLLIVPFLIAYFYAKGFRGYRLKGGNGMKNMVVASTWSLGIVIFLGVYSIPVILLFLFFFSKSFVNTVIYDVRDRDLDKKAGIPTLPAIMPLGTLRAFLITLNIGIYCAIAGGYFIGFFSGLDVFLLSSVHSTFYIFQYCGNCEILRNTFVDGEWILYSVYTILRDAVL